MDIQEISVNEAKKHLDDGSASFIDIRDPGSFDLGHIQGAQSLNETNIHEYINEANKEQTHIIYCYHGNSSMGAAGFFQEQGFTKTYSMSGGYTQWREIYGDD